MTATWQVPASVLAEKRYWSFWLNWRGSLHSFGQEPDFVQSATSAAASVTEGLLVRDAAQIAGRLALFRNNLQCNLTAHYRQPRSSTQYSVGWDGIWTILSEKGFVVRLIAAVSKTNEATQGTIDLSFTRVSSTCLPLVVLAPRGFNSKRDDQAFVGPTGGGTLQWSDGKTFKDDVRVVYHRLPKPNFLPTT